MRWWWSAALLAGCAGGEETDETDPVDTDETDLPIDTDVEDTDTGPPLDPTAVRIVGVASFGTPIGDYWGDTEPSGDVVLGFLAAPSPDPDVLAMLIGRGEGCEAASPPDVYAWDAAPVLAGPRSDLLLSAGDDDFYRAPILREDFAVDEPYDLRPMPTVDGDDAATDVFRFSGVMAWDGPPLRNKVAPAGQPEDLAFTWYGTIVGESWSHVLVTAELRAADGTILHTVRCVAEASAAALTVPASVWTADELAGAWGWYVGIGGIEAMDAPIAGDRGFTRVLVHHAEWGQLVYAP